MIDGSEKCKCPLLDFRVHMYLKSAVIRTLKKVRIKKKTLNLGTLTRPQ